MKPSTQELAVAAVDSCLRAIAVVSVVLSLAIGVILKSKNDAAHVVAMHRQAVAQERIAEALELAGIMAKGSGKTAKVHEVQVIHVSPPHPDLRGLHQDLCGGPEPCSR